MKKKEKNTCHFLYLTVNSFWQIPDEKCQFKFLAIDIHLFTSLYACPRNWPIVTSVLLSSERHITAGLMIKLISPTVQVRSGVEEKSVKKNVY